MENQFKGTPEEWLKEYNRIAESYFNKSPDKRFNTGDWSAHVQDYNDGFTPEQAFYQDLYTDV